MRGPGLGLSAEQSPMTDNCVKPVSQQLEETTIQRGMCIIWIKQMQAGKKIKHLRVVDANNITETPRNFYLFSHNAGKCCQSCDTNHLYSEN